MPYQLNRLFATDDHRLEASTHIPGKMSGDIEATLRACNAVLDRIADGRGVAPRDLEMLAQAGFVPDASDGIAMTAAERIALKHRGEALNLDDLMRRDGSNPMYSLTPCERILKRRGIQAGRNGKYKLAEVDKALQEEFEGVPDATTHRMSLKTQLDEADKLDESNAMVPMDPDHEDEEQDLALLRRMMKTSGMSLSEVMKALMNTKAARTEV